MRQVIDDSCTEELKSDNGSDVELELEKVRSNLELERKPAQSEVKAENGLPKRQRRKPKYLTDYALLTEVSYLTSFLAAMQSEDAVHWRRAMEEEMNSLHENSVWTLVDLAPGKKVVDTRWVFCVKTKADGTVAKYKARLVAKGYVQRPGIDYGETFNPVVRFDTVRTILSIGAVEKLKFRQFDVKTAFLYGTLEEEVYVKQSEGFEDGTNRVCRLNRSLYGLKQSPRCWNKKLVHFLKRKGMKQSAADPCLFIRRGQKSKLMLVVYVDDRILAGSNECEMEQFLAEMEKEFRITKGPLDSFLGTEIKLLRDGSIFVGQETYTRRVLKRFRMDEANAVVTPADTVVSASNEDAVLDRTVPYREAVGALMFLMTTTRPDKAYAISMVSQALEKPTVKEWKALKRIFKYLRGTVNYKLHYKSNGKPSLQCFCDADYAGDVTSRRSRTGVVCMYAGGAVSWLSQKQRSVALSTTEAEYVASSEASRELMWLKRLLLELTDVKQTPVIFIDNLGAVKLSKNPEFHKRSKHIAVRFHFVREKWQRRELDVQHISSEDQTADILTKALPKTRSESLRSCLGMIPFPMEC
uniref:Reverse transcriptase Ty1/copia-type domain-containing protein n=1 Tax=Trichuris muris TaxID=70415 RepID=A0A5S6Q626_TRIMR